MCAAKVTEPALYLDSSALMKLVVDEPESRALRRVVSDRDLVSSEIALTEVQRAVRRLVAERSRSSRARVTRAMSAILSGLAFVPVDRTILMRAGAFEEAFLRTLDSIHIASALAVSSGIEAFLTYDRRQAEAVRVSGLPLLQPA